MRKALGLCVLLAIMVTTPGCLTRDRDHNREHFLTIRRDLHSLHRDVDHVMKWHEPSNLVDREEPY